MWKATGLGIGNSGPAMLKVAQNDQLGQFLVDDKGMTLYLFTKDTPNTSNCYDKCATAWPPLLTTGTAMAGEGVDASKLGTTKRGIGPAYADRAARVGIRVPQRGAKRELLGVYDARLAPVMAEVAGRLGAERVLVGNGHPGMDEVSASGVTTVADFDARTGNVRTYEITPETLGIARGTLADTAGGDAAENAKLVRSVLEGEHSPRRDVVLMNAAAALLAAGEVTDLVEGVVRARESIDSGKALSVLESLARVSTRLGEEARAKAGAE